LLEASRLDPNLAQAHDHLGLVARDDGSLAESEREFRAALAVDPRYTDAAFQLGITLRDSGRMEDAMREWKRLLHDAPDHLLTAYELARTVQRLRSAETLTYEDRLWELQKNARCNSRVELLRALAEAAALAHDWRRAGQYLKDAIDRCGGCVALRSSPLWHRIQFTSAR
jgi:tetratricopeptide (TPR) repeat protein